MDNEEPIFDFMATAEDTGKRLDEMAKRLPGELRAVLTEEWRRSPWLAELPKVIDEAREATKQTDVATRSLARTVKKSGSVVAIAAAIIPLATLGIAYWNLSDLRGQQFHLEQKNAELTAGIEAATQTEKMLAEEIASQKSVIRKLSGTAEVLRNETGGLDVVENGDGAWEVILPASAVFEGRPWRNLEGRFVVSYSVAEK